MDERYFSLGDAAETLSASIFDSEGNRMPVQEMFSAMQDAFLVGALTFYDDYRNPIDLDALKRQKWEFISLYDRDSNHLGLYGETTTPKAINAWLESTGSLYRFPTANSASETQAAPVVAASDGPAKRRTWRDVAWPYMQEVFKSGQYATAKEFYRALEKKAGADSPFDIGTGPNRGSIFVRDISEKLTFKTIQNTVWPNLKKG